MGHNSKITRTNAVKVAPLSVDLKTGLLEPRVMLDANLEWDLNASSALTSVLAGIAQSFEDQFTAVSNVLETFTDQADDAFAAISPLLETSQGILAGANDTEVVDLNPVVEVADRITKAITDLKGTLQDVIDTATFDTMAANINSVIGANKVSATDLGGLYTYENFADGTVSDDIDTFIAGLGVSNTAVARAAFDDNLAAAFGLGSNENFALTLTDVGPADNKLITFTQQKDGLNNDITTAVDVAINLPEVFTDMTSMLQQAIPGLTLPIDILSGSDSGALISFELQSIAVYDDPAEGNALTLDQVGLNIHNFDFAPLVQVGGAIDAAVGTEASLGLLSLNVTALELATFGVYAETTSGFNLGFQTDFTAGPVPSNEWFGHGHSLSVEARIQEVGSNTAVAFGGVDPHRLAEVAFDGTLAFGSVDQNFSGVVGFSSVLDTNSASGLVQGISDTATADFDLTLNGGVADVSPELAAAIESAIEGLAAMGVSEMTGFLEDVGNTIASALRDAAFDLAIPLTDIRMSQVIDEVASVFSSLAQQFTIDPDAFGMTQEVDDPDNAGQTLTEKLPNSLMGAADSHDGLALNDAQWAELLAYDQLQLGIVTPDGNPTSQIVTIDLWTGGVDTSDEQARMNSLLDALNGALGTYGITAALSFLGGLKLSSTANGNGNYNSFAVLAGRRQSDGSWDDTVSLAQFGFDDGQLSEAEDAFSTDGGATNFSGTIARFTTGVSGFEFGTFDMTALEGVSSVRFTITVDGEEQEVDVQSSSGPGFGSLSGFIADFQGALDGKGYHVNVSTNAAGDGLAFDRGTDADGAEETRGFEFNVDPSKLMKALSVDTLIDWVNTELDKTMPGATLELTSEGELIFSFPDLVKTLSITGDDGVTLNTGDLSIGVLNNMSLEAALAAEMRAQFSSRIGIDLAGLATDLITDSGEANALEASRGFGDELLDAVLDNTFLNDLSLDVGVTGSATDIIGTADLGIVSVNIGSEDASQNILALDTQLQATLIGRDAEGAFNEQLSFRNLYEAVADKVDLVDGEVVHTQAPGIGSLLGRFDLKGGIVVDGAGQALAAGGAPIANAGEIQHVTDAFGYTGGDELAQFLFRLGDVKINVAGISGINEDLVDGISATILDLKDIQGSYDVQLLSNDPNALAAIDGLSALEDGDILDTLVAIANVLVVVGDTLSEKMPFLDANIPLLNLSILDQIQFAADFLQALQDLRNDPQSGLDKVEAYLEGVFGQDTVTLTWDGDAQTILFDLEFKFLEDYQKELPFNLDLAALLGDQLADIVGPDLADVVSGLVDVSGDGALIFDPDLAMKFSFGIDLSPTLVTPTVIAQSTQDINALSTVSSFNLAPGGGNDLRLTWIDNDTGEQKRVEVNLEGLTTLGDVVAAIDTAVKAEFGATVSFAYDEASGQITLSDSNNTIIDDTDVTALFGASEVAGADDGGALTVALDAGFTAFADELIFTVSVNGTPVEVTIPAEADRTRAGFIAAANVALQNTYLARNVLSASALPIPAVQLSNLFDLVDDGGTLKLRATDYPQALGYEAITFTVSGDDQSQDIAFKVESLGGSNVARALGFAGDSGFSAGDMTSEVIYDGVTAGAPRVYLDTVNTGIIASFTAGVNDGLELKLGLGPIEVMVENGHALITAGDDAGSPAFLRLGINDIDGDEHADQYDLSHVFEISNDPAVGYADLFDLDAAMAIDVFLPMSDTLGLFDPTTDGLSWKADLLVTPDDFVLANLTSANWSTSLEGALMDIYNGVALAVGDGLGEIKFEMPDLSEFLENLNVLAILNDPKLVLGGLDMLLNQMQQIFDDYLSGINLPVVGDAIGAGVTFFDDFRLNVVQKALAWAETPLADGSYPTTVDFLTGVVNDALNDLLGTSGTQYLQAYLNTDGATEDSYLYVALNFNAIIFDEEVAIDFDLGVPGFDLAVEDGSKVRMTLDYIVNIGFGYDGTGFFLLNDTDENEVSIDFTVDAGSFEGSMSLFGILGVNAEAVTVTNGTVTERASASGQSGTAQLTASLGADLYGDTGLQILNPDDQPDGTGGVTADSAYRDFSGVDVRDGLGNRMDWEKVVYLAQLDTSNLISFDFVAGFDIQIGLEANVLNPETGQPIEFGGAQVIPSVMTELIFEGGYSVADGLNIDKLMFNQVRLDANVLYDALLKPILDPVMGFIEPLADFFKFLSTPPVSFLVDILGNVFPIIAMADTVITVGNQVTQMLVTLNRTGGMVIFGDYDFTGNADDIESGESTMSSMDQSNISRSNADSATQGGGFGVFGDPNKGLSAELPLLTDPFSALNILLGNFDEVDLVRAKFTLFNVDTGVIDVADKLLSEFGMPGWVKKIVKSAFKATFEASFIAKFEVGYDMSGIVNFVNSYDPERLLDGVFIDAAPGSLVDAYLGASVRLNAGLAGLSSNFHVGVQLSFNDPNDDGKLRIPELIALVEAAADSPGDTLGYLFRGSASYKFKLSVWAGISLPWPLPDLKWSTTVFNFGDSIDFGGLKPPAQLATDPGDTGNTAILNVGARAGGSMSTIEGDGDDRIVVDGPNSPFQVTLKSGGQTIQGSFDQTAGAIIVPAGNGNNTVDLSGVNNGIPTVTYTGTGADQITLPPSGVHVVFAGDGIDRITAPSGATGTYVIFGEGGADTVNIPSGNVIYFGDDDFGMRDLFLSEFSSGGVTEAKLLALLGIDASGNPNPSAAANYDYNGGKLNLHNLLSVYTADTQLKAAKDVETVTVGNGNHVILTGAGDDQITGVLTGTGNVHVFSGAGEDVISIGGSDVYIEGGAGADLIKVDGARTEVWGWGKAAGEDGLTASEAIKAMALKDKGDILIGGSGADQLFGQLGQDILEGGAGADVLAGGLENDLINGGLFDMSDSSGTALALSDIDLSVQRTSGLVVASEDIADGNDTVRGGDGADVLIGGGDRDSISGGIGNDILLGDFGTVTFSASMVAKHATTTFDTSSNGGTDVLKGEQGNDILIGGLSDAGLPEVLEDYEGNNIFLGDFGEISGSRILEVPTLIRGIASASGGDDVIRAGRGNDMILGGEGADEIYAGLGADFVLGDLGQIDLTGPSMTGTGSAHDGNDTIVLGVDTPSEYTNPALEDLMDVVIAGGGNDTIAAQAAGLAVLSDSGTINMTSVGVNALRSYVPLGSTPTSDEEAADARAKNLIRAMVADMISAAHSGDGADQLTTTGGDVAAILGGGADGATLADGTIYVMGDDGSIRIDDNSSYTGREVVMTSTASVTAGNGDQITAANGTALVVAGDGNDTISTGNGTSAVMSDSGTLTHDSRSADLSVSLVADVTPGSGDDHVTVGNGDMQLMLGEGADTLIAGNGDFDVLADSGTLRNNAAERFLQLDASQAGGNDSLTVGAGDHIAALGLGDDEARFGLGTTAVLGDVGTVSLTRSTGDLRLSSEGITAGGNDDVTTSDGNDWVLLGSGADTLAAGNGDNLILGDNGVIDVTAAETTLTSTDDATGGVDSVTSGTGHDWVNLGEGADWAHLGAGDNLVMGDNGVIRVAGTSTTLTTQSPALGGNDTITALGGNDMMALGNGADVADLGEGNNIGLGDSGVIAVTPTQTRVESNTAAEGGNDSLTSGAGLDVMVLGSGDDTLAAGSGDNLILGDNGVIDVTAAETTLTSTDDATGGADSVTSGTGTDWVNLGEGADWAHLGAGDNLVMGDNGVIRVAGTSTTLTTQSPSLGGNDTLTALSGNDMMALGNGADVADLGEGNNIGLGDNGVIAVTPTQTRVATSSPELGGNDSLTSGAGQDTIVLGVGDDTLAAGDGDNLILGDNGEITVTSDRTYLTSDTPDQAGADSVTAGSGSDFVVLGGAADVANLGDGDNALIGDNGWIEQTAAHLRLVSTVVNNGGNDNVTTGAGHDSLILGAASDLVEAGDGDNRILGDNGEILVNTSGISQVFATHGLDGADTITTGAGLDVIIGALGADSIQAGHGDNTVIGDMGIITQEAGLAGAATRTAVTQTVGTGDNDTITALDGVDVILGGAGADRISSGAGDDLILGDDGNWTSAHMTGLGQATVEVMQTGGDDWIDAGADNDIVMAAQGNDTVLAQAGEDVVLGDDGTVTFRNETDVETLLLTNQDRGGDDELTALGGSGDNIIIGQFGNDSITGGLDDDLLVGDLVTLQFDSHQNVLPGQSAWDRMSRMVGIREDLGFDDTLYGSDGDDFIMGGFGDDIIYGEAGQDFLIGETVIYVRSWSFNTEGLLDEVITVDTNFAFLDGGYDEMSGGSGFDIMVGGLGPDLFYGDTAEDLLQSDGYAGLFRATWGIDGFAGDTPHRALYTSNYAGLGATDVVSAAQEEDSIGVPLKFTSPEEVEDEVVAEETEIEVSEGYQAEARPLQRGQIVAHVLAYLESAAVTDALANAIAAGADLDLVRGALIESTINDLGSLSRMGAVEFEALIVEVVDYLLSRVVTDRDAVTQMEKLALAAE